MKKYVLQLAGKENYLTGNDLRSRTVLNPSQAKMFSKDTLPGDISGLRYLYVLDLKKMAYVTQNGMVGIEVVDFWDAQQAYEKRIEMRAIARKASGKKGRSMRESIVSLRCRTV